MSLTETYPKKEVPKIKKALEIYLSGFDTKKSVTLQHAVHKAGTLYGYVVDYMVDHGIGMPSDRKDALQYLRKLKS